MAADKKKVKKKKFFLFGSKKNNIEKKFVKSKVNKLGAEFSKHKKDTVEDLKWLRKNIGVFEKRLGNLGSTLERHERARTEAVDMLLTKIKRKKPAKLDKLEQTVKDVSKDLKSIGVLSNSLNKLNADFVKFKKVTDEEIEEIINELKKSGVKKAMPSKDIDKIKEKIGVVSSWNKELNKNLGLVDSNVRLLIKDFEKHKENMKSLEQDFEDDLKIINAKLKSKLPAPPVSPSVEKRLERVENDMSEVMDIAASSKDVADSSRTFMNEVEVQLMALTKMIEEYKTTRIEAEANVYTKLEAFSSELTDLRNNFMQLSSNLNDISGKLDTLLNFGTDLDVLKSKIMRLEKAGFGALIIE